MATKTKHPPHKRPAGGMRRFSIGLLPEAYAEIERIAKRDSRSIGWIARKAVEEYLRQEQPLFHQESK
jgi:predicted transcriptional regulator